MRLRVIAGTARSLKLKTVPGDSTRPTTDRIKETLFNIIGNDVLDCTFLDLFSGSGAIGIEALSRGARECTFVEKDPKCIECIKDNLSFTKLDSRSRVIRSDVLRFINNATNCKPFDIIFMDPPYKAGVEEDILKALSDSCLTDPDSLIIIEAESQNTFDFLKRLDYNLLKKKVYGSNMHLFLSPS